MYFIEHVSNIIF